MLWRQVFNLPRVTASFHLAATRRDTTAKRVQALRERSVSGIRQFMARLRRTAGLGHVCLTVVAVMLAGLPQFHCRCSSTCSQPLALAVPSSASTCCCGGECCMNGADGPSCCGHSVPAEEPATPCSPAGCQWLLSPADPAALAFTKTTAAADTTAGPFLVTPAHPVALVSWTVPGQPAWRTQALPPPTNLVIALQHLVI